MKLKISQRSDAFFDLFVQSAANLRGATEDLKEMVDDYRDLELKARRIQDREHEGDQITHDIIRRLNTSFITPMDREDIHVLSTQLSLVAAFIGGTARRADSLKATTRREPAVAMARIIVRATGAIEAAVGHIRTGEEVLLRCREIKQAEEEGDAIWEAAVAELFSGAPDPVDVIRWKTLYDQLEDTLDACEDVANELETITVKHT